MLLCIGSSLLHEMYFNIFIASRLLFSTFDELSILVILFDYKRSIVEASFKFKLKVKAGAAIIK